MIESLKIESLAIELGLTNLINTYSTFAQEAASKEWGYQTYLEKVLATELLHRHSKRTQILNKLAGFPANKRLEDFDFNFATGVSKKQIEDLSSLSFIERKENLIMLGPSGVGKTHLAIAIGLAAIAKGYSVKFATSADLILQLDTAYKQNKYKQVMQRKFLHPSLLIIDEVGYTTMTKQQANNFFQVIANRYEKGSIIITSNLSYADWDQAFANDRILTVAMLDRLLHHSTTIQIRGSSYRLKAMQKSGLIGASLFERIGIKADTKPHTHPNHPSTQTQNSLTEK